MKDQIAAEPPDFNYAGLGLAEPAAVRLREPVDRAIRIGRKITEQTFTNKAEAADEKEHHKAFATLAEAQCGMTGCEASNYIAIHRQLGGVRRRVVDAGIAPAVLFAIASAPPEVVEQGRRFKVKDVKALLQTFDPDAVAEPIPPAQRGGTRGLLHLVQDEARWGLAELTEHLHEILLADGAALEAGNRRRRVERAKLVDAILKRKRARLAQQGLFELTQCLRMPAHWNETALDFDHEPRPDWGRQQNRPLPLENISTPVPVPGAIAWASPGPQVKAVDGFGTPGAAKAFIPSWRLPMPRPKPDRRRAQAAYQKAYRAQQKASRRPSRDDVARVALHWVITEALRRERERDLCKLRALIIQRLADQGFAREGAAWRFDELLERYESGWDFQRKPHLRVEAEG